MRGRPLAASTWESVFDDNVARRLARCVVFDDDVARRLARCVVFDDDVARRLARCARRAAVQQRCIVCAAGQCDPKRRWSVVCELYVTFWSV